MTKNDPYDRLLVWFGTKSEMARKLGVKPQNVSHWFIYGDFPVRQAVRVEYMTRGDVKVRDLRPELFEGLRRLPRG